MANVALAARLASPKGQAVLDQLQQSGYADWLHDDFVVDERGRLDGRMTLSALARLQQDPRFESGPFWGLHRNVGTDLADFRSIPGTFGCGSLQIVIDRRTGACFADIDRFSPYRGVAPALAHFFCEMVPGWFRKRS